MSNDRSGTQRLDSQPPDMKLFYLHIPKTAGSSINHFLSAQIGAKNCLTHIESHINFQNQTDVENAGSYTLLSGHVILPQAQRHLKVFDNRTTIATFRLPIEHVVSHIAWVRKLGDAGEENRLNKHAKTIQIISKKLVDTDLSSPKAIADFIVWLEKNNYYLFHNVQTKYLCGGASGAFTPQLINQALINLDRIDFVGTVERLGEFLSMLCDRFGWDQSKTSVPKENVNSNTYGLDIKEPAIRKALQPLIQWDHMIYRIARERFIEDMHLFLADLEKRQRPGFSTVHPGAVKQ